MRVDEVDFATMVFDDGWIRVRGRTRRGASMALIGEGLRVVVGVMSWSLGTLLWGHGEEVV